MKKFSILIPSYLENKRLQNLIKNILKDKLKEKIDKIIIVTPDKDLQLPFSKKILVIKERKRKGKSLAIRLGLKKIKTEIVVMLSSDLKMRKNFLRFLIPYFQKKEIGMIIGRPKADKNSKIFLFSKIIWDLHHLLCLKQPKATEICAFRKILKSFPKISADEVYIEYSIRKKGYKIIYEPRAYGYTKSPYSLKHFFSQRKRNFFGHLQILRFYRFKTSSLKIPLLIQIFSEYVKKTGPKNFILLIIVTFIELLARLNALIDFLFFSQSTDKYIKWKRL